MSLTTITGGFMLVLWLTWTTQVDGLIALPGTGDMGAAGGVVLLTGLALAASWVPVTIGNGMVMIMSTAPVMASMLLAGPTGAAWVTLVGCTEPRELRGDVPARGVLESHAILAIAAAGGGAVADALRESAATVTSDAAVADAAAAVGAGLAYLVVNVSLAACSWATREGRSVREATPIRMELASQAVLFIVGLLMAEVYVHAAWWLTVLFLVPLVAVRRSVDLDRVAWLAGHDHLTGLVGRRDFEGRLESALRSSDGRTRRPGVLVVDLDQFKAINDTYGHAVGDAVLCEVAGRLEHAVRRTDLVARLGGDEFAVVIGDAGDDEADLTARAQAVADAVCGDATIDGRQITIAASVGGALMPPGGASRSELLAAADQAMYEAKQARVGGGHLGGRDT